MVTKLEKTGSEERRRSMERDQTGRVSFNWRPLCGQMTAAGDSVAVRIPKVSSSNTTSYILSYYPTQEPSMILMPSV